MSLKCVSLHMIVIDVSLSMFLHYECDGTLHLKASVLSPGVNICFLQCLPLVFSSLVRFFVSLSVLHVPTFLPC